MNVSYHDIKEVLYIFETLVGIFLIIVSVYLFNTAQTATLPICNILPAIILMVVGAICTLFGLETYMLRDDPDIWR